MTPFHRFLCGLVGILVAAALAFAAVAVATAGTPHSYASGFAAFLVGTVAAVLLAVTGVSIGDHEHDRSAVARYPW